MALAAAFAVTLAGPAAASLDEERAAYKRSNYPATAAFTASAEDGSASASAMISLGVLYAEGLGVSRDFRAAHRWYAAVADLGDAGAMYSLGWPYSAGSGVVAEYVEAVRWFHMPSSAYLLVAYCVLGVVARTEPYAWRRSPFWRSQARGGSASPERRCNSAQKRGPWFISARWATSCAMT